MRLNRRFVMFAAIRSNDIQVIQSILSSKRAQWSFNGMDFHLLRESIRCGRKEITNLLLDCGCRTNLPSFVGDSPLHLAVEKPNCSYALVKRLLQRGADVNHRNKWNQTPIQVAFALGVEDKLVRFLLKDYLKKSTLNETDDVGLSYLHMACATADVNFVREFIEEGGADIHARVKECNSPYSGSTPLHMAVEFGKVEVIEYLLERGADVYTPNGEGSTPIHLALELGETDTVELLFEYDRDRRNFCNDNGLSHFMAACACSNSEIAKDFLAKKFIADEFLTANEVVDSPENPDYWLKGFTPLHFAASFGQYEVTELLLADGAHCCATTSDNVTPMQCAEKNGHREVVDYLKAHCQGFFYC